MDPRLRGGADGHGEAKRRSAGLSTAEKDKLDDKEFAFPRERKEPLVDASHVRNAVARFDQVEGVTDTERDEAWRRIQAAATKFGVQLEEKSWRELFAGARAKESAGREAALSADRGVPLTASAARG